VRLWRTLALEIYEAFLADEGDIGRTDGAIVETKSGISGVDTAEPVLLYMVAQEWIRSPPGNSRDLRRKEASRSVPLHRARFAPNRRRHLLQLIRGEERLGAHILISYLT
jgi:hypothetical protein